MIPMLRTRAKPVMAASVDTEASSFGSSYGVGAGLPAVVGEGLVGLGHLVHVLAALDARAKAVGGVEDLVHQPLGHRLLTALPGERGEPAQRQSGAATSAHLDRHLIGRATDPAALDLQRRLDVVERALERDDRVGAGLLAGTFEGAVDDALGGGLLAVAQNLVDQRGD